MKAWIDGQHPGRNQTVSNAASLIRLLYVARGLRGFGDGFAIIILPAYMTVLGYDAVAVGIVATASLLGHGASDPDRGLDRAAQ